MYGQVYEHLIFIRLCGGVRIKTPHVHTLIPETCEYVTLHGKRDSAAVIKERMLTEMERLSWGTWVGPRQS